MLCLFLLLFIFVLKEEIDITWIWTEFGFEKTTLTDLAQGPKSLVRLCADGNKKQLQGALPYGPFNHYKVNNEQQFE